MDGILIVNKEKGYTSRDVVNIVSKCLNTKKIGHTGTLDPMAQGVLVLCINKGLKLMQLLNEHDKEYIAKVIVGYETDTLDITGNITYEKYINITKDMVIDALNKYKGNIIQEVPLYSAVKVEGKRLYEYARTNIPVKLPKKEVNIKSIELISNIVKVNNTFEFMIKCEVSKGTYIRSLIRDIGRELGTFATMGSLIRTKVNNFKIEDSYKLDDIKKGNYKIVNIEDLLGYPKIIVSNKDAIFKIKNGNRIKDIYNLKRVMLYEEKKLLAIYEKDKENGYLKPWKMFI